MAGEEDEDEEEEEEEEAGNEELELEPAASAARSEARSWPAASGRLQMKRRPSGAVIGMVRTPGTCKKEQIAGLTRQRRKNVAFQQRGRVAIKE